MPREQTARRRICIVSSSRADYGLLRGVMRAIRDDDRLTLQLVATGTHLAPAFGLTVTEMEGDGFVPDARVELPLSGDAGLDTARALAASVSGMADALAALRPDILVVLGDRFEIFGAAQAALLLRIPIAHIHGGELTEASFDDSLRHAMTKMAQWHFVAAEPYRDRVLQMGEPDERVVTVGAPGLDDIDTLPRLERATLERDLGIALDAPVLLVTYHPATLANRPADDSMREVLAALDAVDAQVNAAIVVTSPNADPGARALVPLIDRFVAARPTRRVLVHSLGRTRYLSLMRLASAVVGNSSSGILEAPALRRATVNIGDRQRGRLMATSVMQTGDRQPDIVAAVLRALSPEFQRQAERTKSLYGSGQASARIAAHLATVPLTIRKPFVDRSSPGGAA